MAVLSSRTASGAARLAVGPRRVRRRPVNPVITSTTPTGASRFALKLTLRSADSAREDHSPGPWRRWNQPHTWRTTAGGLPPADGLQRGGAIGGDDEQPFQAAGLKDPQELARHPAQGQPAAAGLDLLPDVYHEAQRRAAHVRGPRQVDDPPAVGQFGEGAE